MWTTYKTTRRDGGVNGEQSVMFLVVYRTTPAWEDRTASVCAAVNIY